jgi:hypothetical protein
MKPGDPQGEAPGLPGLRTWRGVYGLVVGSFILWVALLVALERLFP